MFMAYQLSNFVKYPITIYPTAIRFIVTFLIPFAFTGYYPAAYFLGREGFTKGILLTCVVAIVSFIIAYRIWVIGISKYESTGS